MVSAINAALSGYAAATQRLNISAQNIANANSTQTQAGGKLGNKPYVPQTLARFTDPVGGVDTKAEPVNPPSVPVYDPANAAADENGITQYPNVDTAQQLVQAKISSYDAQANISVIKVADKNFKALLDIIA